MKAELSHDILAEKIYAKASSEQLALRKALHFLEERFEFFQEEQVLLKIQELEYLEPFLSQLNLDEERELLIEKSRSSIAGLKKRKLIAGIVLTGFIALAIFSVAQYFRANVKRVEAEEAQLILADQADTLKIAKETLKKQTQTAKAKTEIAQLELDRAAFEQEKADEYRHRSLLASQRAAQARDLAIRNLQVTQNESRSSVAQDSARSAGFLLASKSKQALRDGDFRLAYNFAEKGWNLFEDSMTRMPLLELRSSPFQMSTKHSSKALQVLPSPSGISFLAAYEDNSIEWTKNNGENIGSIQLPTKLLQMEFGLQEKLIYTLTDDDSLRIWKHSGQLLHSFYRKTGKFALVSDSTFLCITHSHDLALINLRGDTVQKFEHRQVEDLLLAKNRTSFISFSKSRRDIYSWNLSGEKIGNAYGTYSDEILSIDLSPQGSQALICMSPKGQNRFGVQGKYEVELWDLKNSNMIRSFKLGKDKKALAAYFPKSYKDTSFWRFDMDRDGVIAEKDMDPNTPLGAKVDRSGKALDSDQDGTIDLFDKSPNDSINSEYNSNYTYDPKFKFPSFSTFIYPHFAYVKKSNARQLTKLGDIYSSLSNSEDSSYNSYSPNRTNPGTGVYPFQPYDMPAFKKASDPYGIPLDRDRDGLPDFQDKEILSPIGALVDEQGRSLDSDNDGLIDLFDQEPHSKLKNSYSLGKNLDNTGVARDSDRDGVIDSEDEEPLTPLGDKVNPKGISLDWKPKGRLPQQDRGEDAKFPQGDEDGDGIKNKDDLEKHTPLGAAVDEQGRAVDSDGDGRPDLIDFEIHTPQNMKTDALGRRIGIRGEWPVHGPSPPNPRILGADFQDEDDDGVPNIFDKESETPLGSFVDQQGVSLDLDQDGVIDLRDFEKTSPRGAPVDSNGIAIDRDADGIIDLFDHEPETPKGLWVDRNGMRVDVDADGIPFSLDKDPYTPYGAPVDSLGFALDSDGDGIIDLVDIEVLTPKGEKVDKYGQQVNLDSDGVPFERDADSDGDGRFDSDILVIVYEDEIGLWRNTSHQQVEKFSHPREEILQAQIAPDGRNIVSYTRNKILREWVSVKGLNRKLVLGSEVNQIAFSPTGDKQYIAFNDGTVRIYYPSKAPSNPEDIILYYRQHLAPLTKEESKKLGI